MGCIVVDASLLYCTDCIHPHTVSVIHSNTKTSPLHSTTSQPGRSAFRSKEKVLATICSAADVGCSGIGNLGGTKVADQAVHRSSHLVVGQVQPEDGSHTPDLSWLARARFGRVVNKIQN